MNQKLDKPLVYYDSFTAIVFQALCVYLIIYWLVPRFMYHKKYLLFTLSALAVVFITAWIDVWLQGEYMKWFFKPTYRPVYLITFISHSIDSLIASILFTLVIMIQYYYKKERMNKLLEKERLETELSFLKAQLNPHFLFNALNSIYVLMEDNKEAAQSTLLKFSALLRYQLYDCSIERVTLEDEINFIKDYIDLEKIRQAGNMEVTLDLPALIPHKVMAPLLLIIFVENAFKFVAPSPANEKFVKIVINLVNNSLTFEVRNTYSEDIYPSAESGIGLKNVKRRLELLYPDRHNLKVDNEHGIFVINLTMTLDES